MTPNHASEFQSYLQEEQHLARMMRRRIARYGDKVALRDRADGPWTSVTWREMGEWADTLGRALIASGVKAGDRVGIFSQNRAWWTIADLAILSIGGVTVPIYATDSGKEAAYIVQDAGIDVLFVNDQEQYDKVCALLENNGPLHTLVAFSSHVAVADTQGSYAMASFLSLGADDCHQPELIKRLSEGKSSDLYTLIYTSGTTGPPKGVMLTHENLLAALFGTGYLMPVGEADVSFAFLPLSHVFERSWTWFILSRGAENHYCHDPREVKAYFTEVRPHYMVSVPRVWEKIYGTIYEEMKKASRLKRKLFHWSLEMGAAFYAVTKAGERPSLSMRVKHAVADKLVLSKIRDVVGGRAKFFHAGGAALNPAINAFFVHAGIRLGVGYGLTELFPICVCTPEDIGFGTCGKPIPLIETRVSDDGEIQASGPCLMNGYWNREDATREALTEDGWLKTGDVGEITTEGYIKITDRIKEIIITAGGKNISPQTVETAIKEDIYVEQAMVVGDGLPFISALVVPAFSMLDNLALSMGLSGLTRTDLVAHPDMVAFYRGRIDEQTKHLGRVEQVRAFTLLPAEFTQEAGELTPTSKLKRNAVFARYRDRILALYAGDRKIES
ncbi:MAG: long-chain fatty acid--CoA ligase [Deltaproteobacteria bacterium]|nr:MAG: long-chain fatty acid--CoA ligase [Deltaproteobacteria bacterium]